MSLETATQVITDILTLLGVLLDWLGSLANPLDEGSTLLDWMFALTVVTPISFIVMKYLVQLAMGSRYKITVQVRKLKERDRWANNKFK